MALWMILMTPPVRRTIASLVALGASLIAIRSADAHAVYMTYMRHDVRVTVSPENIDITIELTFFEMPSLSERRRMDRDRSGVVSDEECDHYLAALADQLDDAVNVTVDGRAVEVMPLYEPQIDLLDVAEVAPTHHVLRLYTFARTPPGFKADSRIVVKDALWPNVPALRSAEVAGEKGITAMIEDDVDVDPSAATDTLRVRCVSMPPDREALKAERAQAGMLGKIVVAPAKGLPWENICLALIVVVAGVGIFALCCRK
jgi:hypothetical protein